MSKVEGSREARQLGRCIFVFSSLFLGCSSSTVSTGQFRTSSVGTDPSQVDQQATNAQNDTDRATKSLPTQNAADNAKQNPANKQADTSRESPEEGTGTVTEEPAVVPQGTTGPNKAEETPTAPTPRCDDGYIAVPESYEFNLLPFCVMKYEAKPSMDPAIAVSTTETQPWVNIDWNAAKTACQAAGAHLVTPMEWMSIARSIELNPENDLEEAEGLQLATGHSDDQPSTSLAASIDDDAYAGTGDDDASPYLAGEPGKAQKRTHTLSNGQIIWDFAGNVAEWVDGTCTTNIYPSKKSSLEWDDIELQISARSSAGPLTVVTSTHGIGKYDGCGTDGNPLTRGQFYGAHANSGIYALAMLSPASATSERLGFRCAKQP